MTRKKQQIIIRVGGFILVALLALLANCKQQQPDSESTIRTIPTDIVEVHFIDVGQGDAILIEAGDASMLIDAGENNKGSIVVDYLKQCNISNLDYVIGTHPHSDHIGGLDTVLEAISVDKVIMPSVSHTTKTFEDLLDIIEEKNLKITKPVVGNEYELGPADFTIIAPNSTNYEDLNDYSVGIKLTYGSNSFLFTGDAGSISEEEMLENGIDLTADVLKLAHHGSAYSSTEGFLDSVNPTYAVICVGADNEYDHPHSKTLQSIKDRGIKLYRTDTQGTVVFTSDGKTISVNTDSYSITNDDLDN